MRAVVQCVLRASVTVGQERVGSIGRGLLVYLAVGKDDDSRDVVRMVEKVPHLRVYAGPTGKITHSVMDVGGSVLLVPQFTLYGDVRGGRRPSFTGAAEPAHAQQLYLAVGAGLRAAGVGVEGGRFRATMVVSADVDGPVTILVDTRKTF